ncbi:hypothetical protein D3C85_343720 [compost metagenome]
MRITASAKIQNNTWRYDPETGFLRCTASILCAGVMTYQREELETSNPPEGLAQLRVYVSPEELSDPEGIATLEGMPAVIGHTWQTSAGLSDCGSISGAPYIQSDHLIADILLKQPEAVRRVMLPAGDPQRLEEISSAGDWGIIWEPGISPDGEAYDGYFVKLRYNHVALLPPGAGRAGASVRIINEKEAPTMEFTRVQIRNTKTGKSRVVRVANEDAPILEEALAENEEVAKTAITPEQLNAALEELKTLKEERDKSAGRIAELEGMIQSYKDQLDAALSTDAVAAAAEEMAVENEEAVGVMNAKGLKLDTTKKLRGHALRSHVVNSVRVANGKPELTADELKEEGFVKGMYLGLVETSGVAPRQIPGASVVINNSHQVQEGPNMANPNDRMARLYPTAKKGA